MQIYIGYIPSLLIIFSNNNTHFIYFNQITEAIVARS